MPENAEAWELWSLVANQWRSGGMGVIGLDMPAILQVASIVGIEVDEGLVRKLRAIEETMLASLPKKDSPEGADHGT